MTDAPFRDFGWTATSDDALARELTREVARGHCLFGVPVRAVAQCGDDVLFQLLESPDADPAYAEVHLTFTSQSPDEPPWPTTQLYDNLGQWQKRFLDPDPAMGTAMAAESERVAGLTIKTWGLLLVLIVILWIVFNWD